MYSSANINSGLAISTQATTITTLPFPYMTQAEFDTTTAKKIKYLLANFDGEHSKQDANTKETIE